MAPLTGIQKLSQNDAVGGTMSNRHMPDM